MLKERSDISFGSTAAPLIDIFWRPRRVSLFLCYGVSETTNDKRNLSDQGSYEYLYNSVSNFVANSLGTAEHFKAHESKLSLPFFWGGGGGGGWKQFSFFVFIYLVDKFSVTSYIFSCKQQTHHAGFWEQKQFPTKNLPNFVANTRTNLSNKNVPSKTDLLFVHRCKFPCFIFLVKNIFCLFFTNS